MPAFCWISIAARISKLEKAYAAKRTEPGAAIAMVESREGRASRTTGVGAGWPRCGGPGFGEARTVIELYRYGGRSAFSALAELPEADRILHVLDFSLLPAAGERYVAGREPGTV